MVGVARTTSSGTREKRKKVRMARMEEFSSKEESGRMEILGEDTDLEKE
jgi:hypothetical protein